MTKNTHPFTNQLIHETSPYLLQHAHNPVNWMPWGEQALDKAKKENKPIIVSIGYAACHWCHVMEHESFEDTEVASIMNCNFVCIKVDREEMPDVDQLYMSAVHLLGTQGGWPLNVVALPDGRPFWGGTYFQKATWINILYQIAELYTTKPHEVLDYAERLSAGIKQAALVEYEPLDLSTLAEVLHRGVESWKQHFDVDFGGNNRAPKFMMPNNQMFLLQYGHQFDKKEILKHVHNTCSKMAQGGVYDQIGGGFSRYSVDAYWKVPHFEKMLYDNGQLISLYSLAYQKFKNSEFKKVVYQSIKFISRELTSKEGFFYASLDADSEGEEGKFYVWKKEELRALLNEDFDLFCQYYHVNKNGLWEHGNYILIRMTDDQNFAEARQIPLNELKEKVVKWNSILLNARSKRIRPALDDKILTSWNAIMGVGLLDAYLAFNEDDFLKMAQQNASLLVANLMEEDGSLKHSYHNGNAMIDGFLEDYAHVIQFFTRLFQTTGEQSWYNYSMRLMKYVNLHFWDSDKEMYTFNSQKQGVFITHQYEVYDNVIPASNSVLAHALFKLGKISDKVDWVERAQTMTRKQLTGFAEQYSGLSNWGMLAIHHLQPFYEVVVSGDKLNGIKKEIGKYYCPNVLQVFTAMKSEVPLLKNRYNPSQTSIYVCQDKVCKLPVSTWNKAVGIMENKK